MKVIVGSPVWSLNGVNIFSASLVRGLRAAGTPATILLTGVTYRETKPMPLPRDIPLEHLRIPTLATWRRRRRALADFLESEAPCIYVPNHDFLHSWATAALSPRVGVVGVIHSDDAHHYAHAARMGRTWNAAVAVSEAIARRIRTSGDVEASRLSVIPCGVCVGGLPTVRRATGEGLRLIYAGRLEAEQKRVADLLRIASALVRRGVRFTLTIVGDGPEKAALARDITARGLSFLVKMIAPVSNERVIEMCAESDAFVLPSAYEGMPISLLEAMGQGCVPIATDIASGVPELIRNGENGFIVPVGDVQRFADCLETIAGSPVKRERMSREAWRTIAEGRYHIDVMTARYIELFERVSREIEAGEFIRPGAGGISPMTVSLRERIAAPLWSFRPSVRAQQNPAQ